MVCHTLQPTEIMTRGDTLKAKEVLTCGVQQGSPVSPALFNIFIDELALDIENRARFDVERAAIFYADDVLLLGKSEWEVQRLLDIATQWAQRSGMTWNTSKSHIIVPADTNMSFILAGAQLQCVEQIKYLGATLSLTIGLRKKRASALGIASYIFEWFYVRNERYANDW